jgi:DNA-damage-inducible protein J
MPAKEATIRARVPEALKADTDAVFAALGMTSSEAIRLFLSQVKLRRGLPFSVALPAVDENSDLLLSRGQRQSALDLCYDD